MQAVHFHVSRAHACVTQVFTSVRQKMKQGHVYCQAFRRTCSPDSYALPRRMLDLHVRRKKASRVSA